MRVCKIDCNEKSGWNASKWYLSLCVCFSFSHWALVTSMLKLHWCSLPRWHYMRSVRITRIYGQLWSPNPARCAMEWSDWKLRVLIKLHKWSFSKKRELLNQTWTRENHYQNDAKTVKYFQQPIRHMKKAMHSLIGQKSLPVRTACLLSFHFTYLL